MIYFNINGHFVGHLDTFWTIVVVANNHVASAKILKELSFTKFVKRLQLSYMWFCKKGDMGLPFIY